MKVQPMRDLMAEMIAVVRGEREASADAAMPSAESAEVARMVELRALAALPDDQINARDIPEQQDWSSAKRGLFFRPAKAPPSDT